MWMSGYLAIWIAAGVLFSTPIMTIRREIPNAPPTGYFLAVVLTGWLMRALFGVVAVALARWVPIQRATAWRAVPLHLLASVVVALAKIAFCAWLTRRLAFLPDASFKDLFIQEFSLDVTAYWVVLGGVHAVQYYRGLRRREQEAAELSLYATRLQEQLTRAQLDALRAQLQPHFLFNALNSISALVREDPEAADQMIEQLSDFLRGVVENGGAPEVELGEELTLLDRYLSIQRTRYHDRLDTRVTAAPGTLDALVPNLILQPLVENAIRHGLEQHAEKGSIRIHADQEEDVLTIRIEDDGPGPSRASQNPGTRVGLANARARLQQLYGSAGMLTLEQAPSGGAIVILRLPYRTGMTAPTPLVAT